MAVSAVGSFTARKRVRKTFGRIAEASRMPNLIEVQKSSYDAFLQMDSLPDQRGDVGLQEVFKSVFPIRDFSERSMLEFVRYAKSRNTTWRSASSAADLRRSAESDVTPGRLGR